MYYKIAALLLLMCVVPQLDATELSGPGIDDVQGPGIDPAEADGDDDGTCNYIYTLLNRKLKVQISKTMVEHADGHWAWIWKLKIFDENGLVSGGVLTPHPSKSTHWHYADVINEFYGALEFDIGSNSWSLDNKPLKVDDEIV